jgi:hypothetical protein
MLFNLTYFINSPFVTALPIQRFRSDPFISDSNVVVPKSDDNNSKLSMLNVDHH